MAELTPADELRQAAATLRRIAQAALEGAREPGSWYGQDEIADAFEWTDFADSADVSADAAWIALMHPGLAEPLAVWLESWDGFDVPESAPHSDDWEYALKVARQINTKREGA